MSILRTLSRFNRGTWLAVTAATGVTEALRLARDNQVKTLPAKTRFAAKKLQFRAWSWRERRRIQKMETVPFLSKKVKTNTMATATNIITEDEEPKIRLDVVQQRWNKLRNNA